MPRGRNEALATSASDTLRSVPEMVNCPSAKTRSASAASSKNAASGLALSMICVAAMRSAPLAIMELRAA